MMSTKSHSKNKKAKNKHNIKRSSVIVELFYSSLDRIISFFHPKKHSAPNKPADSLAYKESADTSNSDDFVNELINSLLIHKDDHPSQIDDAPSQKDDDSFQKEDLQKIMSLINEEAPVLEPDHVSYLLIMKTTDEEVTKEDLIEQEKQHM